MSLGDFVDGFGGAERAVPVARRGPCPAIAEAAGGVTEASGGVALASEDVTDDGVTADGVMVMALSSTATTGDVPFAAVARATAGSVLDSDVLERQLTSPIASTSARIEPATIPTRTVHRDFLGCGPLHPSDTLCRLDDPWATRSARHSRS